MKGQKLKKENKVDAVINEALESKRLQQGGRFIKKAIIIGIILFVIAAAIGFTLDSIGV